MDNKMRASLEALAMSKVDYNECGMTIEEWERSEMVTPPHLLADDEEEEEEDHKCYVNLRQVPDSRDICSRKNENNLVGLQLSSSCRNMMHERSSSTAEKQLTSIVDQLRQSKATDTLKKQSEPDFKARDQFSWSRTTQTQPPDHQQIFSGTTRLMASCRKTLIPITNSFKFRSESPLQSPGGTTIIHSV